MNISLYDKRDFAGVIKDLVEMGRFSLIVLVGPTSNHKCLPERDAREI